MSSESFWSAQQACFGRSLKYFKLFDNRFHVYHQPTINKKFDAEKCFCVWRVHGGTAAVWHAVHILLFAIITIMPDRHLQGEKTGAKGHTQQDHFSLFMTQFQSHLHFLTFKKTVFFCFSTTLLYLINTMEPDIYTGGGKFSTSATSNVSMHNA